jgi:hypothetical protein
MAAALVIADHGFDPRKAKLESLYGAGSYFAVQSCKSQQYAKPNPSSECVMLLCRVTMGWPFKTTTYHDELRRPPDNPATPGPILCIYLMETLSNHTVLPIIISAHYYWQRGLVIMWFDRRGAAIKNKTNSYGNNVTSMLYV